MLRVRTPFTLFLLARLPACPRTSRKEAVEGLGNAAQWQAHKQRIAALDGWQIDGKVGIRAPRDSGSGTLFWLQRQDYYDIRLAGPLGRGATRLTGRPGAVTLDVSGQGSYQADSPEALVQDGWTVEYTRYTEQNGYTLPERLKLTGKDLEVILVVKTWQPRELGK